MLRTLQMHPWGVREAREARKAENGRGKPQDPTNPIGGARGLWVLIQVSAKRIQYLCNIRTLYLPPSVLVFYSEF